MDRSAVQRIALGAVLVVSLVGCGAEPPAPVPASRMADCIAPLPPPSATGYALEPVAPKLKIPFPTQVRPDPQEAGRWWALEQAGRVLTFVEGEQETETSTLLDIEDLVRYDHPELGLLGLTFHPDYPERPHVYLFYTGYPVEEGTHIRIRVSRFDTDPASRRLDRGSEKVILTADFPSQFHHGGTLEFGPDDLLYIGLGEGGDNHEAQNTESLGGTVLRIDVDSGDPYAIPPDNPFALGGGRPEIFAWGLRNPWKFTFDRLTGDLWAGDVGEILREEMNLVERGRNYGWPIWEGDVCRHDAECADPSLESPDLTYDHETGKAIIGGYVYRGAGVPSLYGKLLFGDYGVGGVWSHDPENPADGPRLLHAENQLMTTLAEDLDGEVYLVFRHGRGNLRRIVEQPTTDVDGDLPPLLSSTGCVSPDDPTRPAGHLLAYSVAQPLWSDTAAGPADAPDGDSEEARRWVSLPEPGTVGVDVGGRFLLPEGSVVMKHRRFKGRILETQLLMHHPGGNWAGYAYAWNDEGTDARLLTTGEERRLESRRWQHPGRGDCMRCHSAAAGRVLGLETAQLWTAEVSDPFATWREAGAFAGEPAGLSRPETPIGSPTDRTDRARDYLHVNCSSCHRPDGPAYGDLDLRREVDFAETGLCNAPPQLVEPDLPEGSRLLVPGEPKLSTALQRMRHKGSLRMPPVGDRRLDRAGIVLMRNWIRSISEC